jgi:predicted extracellular nuclease
LGFNPAPFTSAYDISLNKFRKYYAIITKVFQTALVAIFCNTLAWGQPAAGLRVSFWNVENLFDMENDLEKNDDEFARGGRKNVTQEIYDLKLKNCATVLTDLNADILGICEVENQFMMTELNRVYTDRDYAIVHFDSPDSRGIDCALFYDPTVFTVLESRAIKNVLPGNLPTRDIVHVQGTYQDQVLHIFVNHWPSNYGGKEKAIPKRAATANLVENVMLDILADDPDADILLIGDFNEEPIDSNILEFKDMKNGQRFANPFTNLMDPLVGKSGVGTYVYQGQDNLLDQIIASSGLMNSGPLKILPGSLEILDQPKYRQQEGKFAHYPFRFWAGNRLLGGYSDHLTVSVTVIIDK